MPTKDTPEMDWKLVLDLLENFGDTRYINEQLPTWRSEHRNPQTRESEPWTQVDLANAMRSYKRPDGTQPFGGMNKSVIWKIENPDKPSGGRQVSLDEAIAFAKVFGKTLPEVLLPPYALAEVDGWKHFMAATEALNDALYAWGRYEDEILFVRNRISYRPQLRERIAKYRVWAEARYRMQVRETWENDEQGTGVKLAQYMKGFAPTPAMVAAEDALSDRVIPPRLWPPLTGPHGGTWEDSSEETPPSTT